MYYTPPIPRSRRGIIGPLLLGAATLLASCDKITQPNAIQPPDRAQASGGATALGSATLGHGASNVPVGSAPANKWVIVRISGGLTPRQNPDCVAAATPYWACPGSMYVPVFDPKPYPSGPVEIWRDYGTSRSRMTVRAGGGGAIGLFRTNSAAAITATVNVSVPNWYMPGANPIPAFFMDGSYTVTTEAVDKPLNLTEGAAGAGGARQYTLATMHGLQFMNPTDPYYFANYPTPFVSWRFIPGSNVGDTPSGEYGVNVSACANMATCSYTPTGPGRMEASAYVEGREVKVRSVLAPIDPCAASASAASFNCTETPSLTLTCPGAVQRTNTVTCTVSASLGGTLTDIQWTFEPDLVVIHPKIGRVTMADTVMEETTDPLWEGRLVLPGTVTVRASVDAVPDSASATVSITERSWNTGEVNAGRINLDWGNPPLADASGWYFGMNIDVPSGQPVPVYVGAETGVDVSKLQTVASGPNRGYQYFQQHDIKIHRAFLINKYITQPNPAADIRIGTTLYNRWNALNTLVSSGVAGFSGSPSTLFNATVQHESYGTGGKVGHQNGMEQGVRGEVCGNLAKRLERVAGSSARVTDEYQFAWNAAQQFLAAAASHRRVHSHLPAGGAPIVMRTTASDAPLPGIRPRDAQDPAEAIFAYAECEFAETLGM